MFHHLLPHNYKSHMHVLKPEAINRKNIQNVLTNIKKSFIYIYISIYIYVEKPIQEDGKTVLHKRSSCGERATIQTQTGGNMKHEIRTKEKKRAKSEGVRSKYCDHLQRLQLLGSPLLFGMKSSVKAWGVGGVGGMEEGYEIQFQNLHVIEKAHWGFKVISALFLSNFATFPTEFHFAYTCCFMETVFTNRFVPFFVNCFSFFLRKQN